MKHHVGVGGPDCGLEGAGGYPNDKYGTFARKYSNRRVSEDKVYSLLCYETV